MKKKHLKRSLKIQHAGYKVMKGFYKSAQKRIAELQEIEGDWRAIKGELAEATLRISQLEKQIAEYETILSPIRPEDAERLAPWEPIPDNVQGIACGTYHTAAHFSTDDDGRLVKVESQGNAIIIDLRYMRICCRRGMWAPF